MTTLINLPALQHLKKELVRVGKLRAISCPFSSLLTKARAFDNRILLEILILPIADAVAVADSKALLLLMLMIVAAAAEA